MQLSKRIILAHAKVSDASVFCMYSEIQDPRKMLIILIATDPITGHITNIKKQRNAFVLCTVKNFAKESFANSLLKSTPPPHVFSNGDHVNKNWMPISPVPLAQSLCIQLPLSLV